MKDSLSNETKKLLLEIIEFKKVCIITLLGLYDQRHSFFKLNILESRTTISCNISRKLRLST